MNEILLITTDQLREIFNECLNAHFQPKEQHLNVIEPKYLYSLKELASFLNCSIVTAQKIKNSGRIRFKQCGRKCLFITTEILQDLEINPRKHR